jgi:hypothetical protein
VGEGTSAPDRIQGEVRWRWNGFLPRSFLFSADRLDHAPENLNRIPVPEGDLYVSPDYVCHVQAFEDSFIALIGHCCDLADPDAREAEIAAGLLRVATRDGIDAMLAGTDDLLGRFAAICRIRGRWSAFADATAMRTIYFAEDKRAVASHSTLLGTLVGAAPRVGIFQHYWCGLPGNASPVPGVRALPANFALDLDTRAIRRFWPRAERIERSVSDVIGGVEEALVRAARATAVRWKPILSLTAGLDSRLSLAILRDTPGLTAFTYHLREWHDADAAIARQLCEQLGVGHRTLTAVERNRAESAYQLIESIVDCTFEKRVAVLMLGAFGNESDIIHVRSNLAEIGRAFWRGHTGMPRRLDPSNWLQVGLKESVRRLPQRTEAERCLREEMARFFTTAGYDTNDPSIKGYDIWDLVYTEHRMSTWHGQALLGTDMTFDTSILFNARRILEPMLAVPYGDRRNGTLLREIVARRCPEIAGIPVNPRPRRGLRELGAAAYRQLKRRSVIVRAIAGHARM